MQTLGVEGGGEGGVQTLGMCRSQTFGYDLNADVKVCVECRH